MGVATTFHDTRTSIRESLHLARSGAFVDLEKDETFAQPTSQRLLAESKVPLLLSYVTDRNFEAGLPLLNSIDTSLASGANSSPDPLISWCRRNASGALFTELGRFDEAEHELALALIIADRARNDDWQAASLLNVANIQIRTGRPVAAAQTLARLITSTNHGVHKAHAYSHVADLLETQDQTKHVLEYRRLALDTLPAAFPHLRLWLLAPLIVSLIAADELEEAASAITRSHELLRETKNERLASVIGYIEATLLLKQGRPEAALAKIESRPEAVPLGARAVQNLCPPLIRAEVLVAAGREGEAIEHLENWDLRSLTIFEECRTYALLVTASQRLKDWPRVTFYQERLLHSLRRRRGDPRTLLRLNRQHASALHIEAQHDELVSVHSQLEATRAERNDLLDIASQDVMSPLTTLRLILHQLQQSPRTRDIQDRKAETIRSTLDRMEALIPQLSILGDTRDPLGSDLSNQTDLGELIPELVVSHQWASAHNSITIDLTMEPGASLIVTGNRLAITHILDSILANAIRSSTTLGEVQIVVGTRDPDERVLDLRSDDIDDAANTEPTTYIAVTDAGPGLIDHDTTSLFSKYVRPAPDHDAKASGGGLNLYVAQKLARSIGAELSADNSSEGVGTCVNLELALPSDNRPE